LNVVLGNTNDLLKITSGEHKTAFNQMFPGFFELPEAPEVVEPIKGRAPSLSQAFPGQTVTTGGNIGDKDLSGRESTTGDNITVYNTFPIPNADPTEVAKIATEVMNEGIKTAKRSIVQTEE
jgi:hypothetical protein